MEENKKFFKEVIKYKLATKKIETILTVITLMLFMFSFSGGTLAGILFFGVSGLLLLYYFFIFRKKSHYVILDGDKVTVHDGIWLTPVVINTEKISKVAKSDKSITVYFTDESGASKTIEIKALILDPDDFAELFKRLSFKL